MYRTIELEARAHQTGRRAALPEALVGLINIMFIISIVISITIIITYYYYYYYYYYNYNYYYYYCYY